MISTRKNNSSKTHFDYSLRVTADISHFVVVSERLLDEGEGDRELLRTIIPHVGHIHARIGTTQASQCPDPTNEVFTAEREFFERIWKQIIEATAKSHPITFVPEYGYVLNLYRTQHRVKRNAYANHS